MRKILKFLPLALALAACSSMEPGSDFERYGNLLPPDFNLAKFSELNPDIAALQVADTIAIINKAWEADTITKPKETINDLKSEDRAAFIAEDGDGRTIAKKYFKWNDEIIEAAAKETNPPDTTAQGRWLRFNIYGSTGELAFLEAFLQSKTDSSLILQTYTMYARKDGRPYRNCKSSELANEVKNNDMDGVIKGGTASRPTYSFINLFFCDHEGVVRRATDFGNN